MADKKVKYVEPKGYFTKEMLKVAREWDKQHAAEKETKKDTKKK